MYRHIPFPLHFPTVAAIFVSGILQFDFNVFHHLSKILDREERERKREGRERGGKRGEKRDERGETKSGEGRGREIEEDVESMQ